MNGPASRRPRRRPLVRHLVLLALAAAGLYFVWPNIVSLFSHAPGLRAIAWFWFVLMGALELASFACAWGLLRLALNEKSWFLAATTQLTGNAFSRVIPGGAASGGSMSYQLLAAAGIPRARIVTSLTATTLLSNAVLLALPALSIPGILGGALVDRALLHPVEVGVGVFVIILGAGALLLFTDRPLRIVGDAGATVAEPAVPPAPADGRPRRHAGARAQPDPGVIGAKWWQALLFAAGNWLLDWGALLAALAAVGARPRASLVLIAYVVAALLGMLPFTPGGLGFVEVGLTAMLPLAGVAPPARRWLRSPTAWCRYWLPIPTGFAAYLVFRRRYRPAAAPPRTGRPKPGRRQTLDDGTGRPAARRHPAPDGRPASSAALYGASVSTSQTAPSAITRMSSSPATRGFGGAGRQHLGLVQHGGRRAAFGQVQVGRPRAYQGAAFRDADGRDRELALAELQQRHHVAQRRLFLDEPADDLGGIDDHVHAPAAVEEPAVARVAAGGDDLLDLELVLGQQGRHQVVLVVAGGGHEHVGAVRPGLEQHVRLVAVAVHDADAELVLDVAGAVLVLARRPRPRASR